jgi:hypothetical protein
MRPQDVNPTINGVPSATNKDGSVAAIQYNGGARELTVGLRQEGERRGEGAELEADSHGGVHALERLPVSCVDGDDFRDCTDKDRMPATSRRPRWGLEATESSRRVAHRRADVPLVLWSRGRDESKVDDDVV